jgi:hypothetical protein
MSGASISSSVMCPRRVYRRSNPFEHPDVGGPLPERRDKAGPVGVQAEPRQQRTERELSGELKARSTGVNRIEPVSVSRNFSRLCPLLRAECNHPMTKATPEPWFVA